MRSLVAPQTADIWLHVAADYLIRKECVALSSTCRFMRNLLLPTTFSTLIIYSRRDINHVLSKKSRKMLAMNESRQHSPFLATLRTVCFNSTLTRTQDYVIRFNLPLMCNLSRFQGRYRANTQAMRIYAILRNMPTLKDLSLTWKTTYTGPKSPDIVFKDPPLCALTVISTSGAILDDLLDRTDSPCIKSFEEFNFGCLLEAEGSVVAQLIRLGPFPNFQHVVLLSNTRDLNPQLFWNLFDAHPSITSLTMYDSMTGTECIRLPQNLRKFSFDDGIVTKIVYAALEKHRREDGRLIVPVALETALSQCSHLEEFNFIGTLSTSAPIIVLLKSLISNPRISLKRISLLFCGSPPFADFLDILVPLLHEPLIRGCETVNILTPIWTTAPGICEEDAEDILSELEEIGRTVQERAIGTPWTRLELYTNTRFPVVFKRITNSDEWILPPDTYDSEVIEAIEAKHGPWGIRFSTQDRTSTVVPRVYIPGQWGREYFTPHQTVIPYEECIARLDWRMHLEGAKVY